MAWVICPSITPPPCAPQQTAEQPADGSRPASRNAALPAGATFVSVTLELAVAALAGPASLGSHPGDGKPVLLHMRGRYGPYIQHKSLLAAIPKASGLQVAAGGRLGRGAPPNSASHSQARARASPLQPGPRASALH